MSMQLKRLRKIETFEEGIEASKYLSRAVFEGILDDFGDHAELQPIKVALDEAGAIVGINFRVRCSAEHIESVKEGVVEHAGFRREFKRPGSNIRILRPMSDEWVEDDEVVREYALG